jgi:ATP-dependent DNA ligase
MTLPKRQEELTMATKKPLRPRLQFALASKYKELPIIDPVYVEPLLGGIRGAIVFTGAAPTVFTLLGRVVVNAWPVAKELEESNLIENCVLDGEFLTSDPDELGAVMANQSWIADVYNIRFHAYDIMTLDQWNAKVCEMPLHYRKSILAELLLRGNYKRTLFTPAAHAGSLSEVLKITAMNKHIGYGGSVYKDIAAPYPFGNTLDWLVNKK